MIVGIDFDGTFAANPHLFSDFVRLLRVHGWQAVLVTGRSDDGQWGDEVRAIVNDLIPIVFAGRRWKKEAASEAGYEVDIWIDDHPESIAPAPVIVGGGRDRESGGR